MKAEPQPQAPRKASGFTAIATAALVAVGSSALLGGVVIVWSILVLSIGAYCVVDNYLCWRRTWRGYMPWEKRQPNQEESLNDDNGCENKHPTVGPAGMKKREKH